MKKFDFGKNKWRADDFVVAYSFRFTETPAFTQHEDCLANAVNAAHREGYDNISLLTKETYGAGVKASVHCAFEGKGCPEIILVEQLEPCEDGAVRYGACFEVVLYKGGVNVWRHYRLDGVCSWHKRLGVAYPVAENTVHELAVEIKENYLIFTVNGQRNTLRVDDLPARFHMGITVCEGIARVYDMTIDAD